MTPQPDLRIGDAEREAAVSALGEHYAAGRLTKEEYDERAAVAWAAKTNAALWPLFADLPRQHAAPRASASGRPGPERQGSWTRIGLLPVLLLLAIVVLVFKHHHVWLILAIGWLMWLRTFRHSRHEARRRRRQSEWHSQWRNDWSNR
jgi:Domain of unknown function (DUF1707)